MTWPFVSTDVQREDIISHFHAWSTMTFVVNEKFRNTANNKALKHRAHIDIILYLISDIVANYRANRSAI